jgi:hypothetical protein
MAVPKFLGMDLSTMSNITWSAGVNSSYPVSNLQTYFAADITKSNATTDAQTLTFQLSATLTANAVVISGQNFASLGASSVKLQFFDSTWQDAVTFTISDNNTQWKTFSSQTSDQWRILFTKGSALSTPPQIGNFFLGTSLDFDYSYDWDFAKANKQYSTSVVTSLDGRIRASQAYQGRKMYDLKFRLLSDSNRTSWLTFVNTVRGPLYPFYFIDVDGTTIDYIHFVDELQNMTGYRYNQNNVNIKLQSQLTS